MLATFLVVLSFGLTAHSMRIEIPKDTLQWHIGDKLMNVDALPGPLQSLTEPMRKRIEEAVANTVDLRVDTSVAGCFRRLFESNLSAHSYITPYFVLVCVIIL